MVDNGKEVTAISKGLLKAESGEFDLESIFCLSLSNSGIDDLGCIDKCSALERLDLSCNNISRLLPLSSLCSLSHLDLSSNRISNLDGLQMLTFLVSLNVAGNLIPSCDSVRVLCGLEKLAQLQLKDDLKGLTNPVCHNVQYKLQVISILPSLAVLDGEWLTGQGSEVFKMFAEMDKTIGDLKSASEGRNSMLHRSEPWFSQELLRSGGRAVDHTVDDIHSAETQIADLLSDCRQLLQAFDEKLTVEDLSSV